MIRQRREVAADMEEDGDCVPDEDVLDDWFIESLKMYKDLYVYQLEHPTQVMEWTSAKSVCVAGNSSSRCEILELELPPRLSATQNQGLCAGRDFRVLHGGFSDGPVRHLAHVPGTRCIVTNDGRSSQLQVWEVAEDASDVIRRSRTIEGCSNGRGPVGGSRVAARRWASPQVLHGATCSQVQLTDLTSGQTLFSLDSGGAEPLASLQFISGSVFLTGRRDGTALLADVRTPGAANLSLPPPLNPTAGSSAPWWTAAAEERPAGTRLLRVASSGLMETSDLRKGGGAVGRARLHLPARPCPLGDDVTASWAPALDGYIAVSGFGGAVQVFDTSSWGAELQDARLLFEHRGHAPSPATTAATVSTHAWHPERARTLLSAATDGSVHVWDWIDQSAGS
ncbi:integrator complex assembly factor WDR73 [Nelusetta ayraudi]|uniref:integrator complex assembly factor WDR73 n=1 Tax=Nelusetta ayraudi TaxID=303726 RepID=UPI003F709540